MSYVQLLDAIDAGVITHVHLDQVNSASIDVRLGDEILVEMPNNEDFPDLYEISLAKREPLHTRVHKFSKDGPFKLFPGECILAHTVELFNLPNTISAMFKLKSSCGRIFLEHMNAGWCDAGWHGSALTMELKNNTRCHVIVLNGGERIGQIVFFQHATVPEDKSYAVRGHYNKDKGVSGAKPTIIFGEEAEDIAQEVFDTLHPVPAVVEIEVETGKRTFRVDEENDDANR